MIDEKEQLESFLDRYDDLAVSLTEDDKPNTHHGLPYSNQEMTEVVCETMDWDGFDLFSNIDFDSYYKSEDVDIIRAACFIAFLRMDVFYTAAANGIGDLNFNKIAATHSEFWFRKFNDRFNAVQGKTGEQTHKWIN